MRILLLICFCWWTSFPQHCSLQLEPHLDRSKGEFGLHIDLDVLLWLESRTYHKLTPLHVLGHLGFVVVNNETMEEFEEFKLKEVPSGFSVFKCNHLLNLWLSNHKEVHQYTQYGASHVCLQFKQVDNLCEWVTQLREEVQKKGRQILANLAQQHTESV